MTSDLEKYNWIRGGIFVSVLLTGLAVGHGKAMSLFGFPSELVEATDGALATLARCMVFRDVGLAVGQLYAAYQKNETFGRGIALTSGVEISAIIAANPDSLFFLGPVVLMDFYAAFFLAGPSDNSKSKKG